MIVSFWIYWLSFITAKIGSHWIKQQNETPNFILNVFIWHNYAKKFAHRHSPFIPFLLYIPKKQHIHVTIMCVGALYFIQHKLRNNDLAYLFGVEGSLLEFFYILHKPWSNGCSWKLNIANTTKGHEDKITFHASIRTTFNDLGLTHRLSLSLTHSLWPTSRHLMCSKICVLYTYRFLLLATPRFTHNNKFSELLDVGRGSLSLLNYTQFTRTIFNLTAYKVQIFCSFSFLLILAISLLHLRLRRPLSHHHFEDDAQRKEKILFTWRFF